MFQQPGGGINRANTKEKIRIIISAIMVVLEAYQNNKKPSKFKMP